MTNLQHKVSELPDSEILQIICEYEQFEKSGSLGPGSLREFSASVLGQDNVLTMQVVVFECYRHFANKWLNETDKGMNLQQRVN